MLTVVPYSDILFERVFLDREASHGAIHVLRVLEIVRLRYVDGRPSITLILAGFYGLDLIELEYGLADLVQQHIARPVTPLE